MCMCILYIHVDYMCAHYIHMLTTCMHTLHKYVDRVYVHTIMHVDYMYDACYTHMLTMSHIYHIHTKI